MLEPPIAMQLERAIARSGVMNAQDLFGEDYVIPTALRDAFEEDGPPPPNPRVAFTWDVDIATEMGEELGIDMGPVIEHLEGGGRMRPFELRQASESMRWEYWEWLLHLGMDPKGANDLEKAIARSAVMEAQDEFR